MKYKDICLILDDIEISCTKEDNGGPLVTKSWDDRIVWTLGPEEIRRVTNVQDLESIIKHMSHLSKILFGAFY